jgi:hypothetical protein
MALPVVYRQAARREIVNVARTYEGRRFPFGLFYLEEDQRIVVLACLDLRRDPEAIASTVTTRTN